MQDQPRAQFFHAYFESIHVVKDGIVIGMPSESFWDDWKEAKRRRRDGAMMEFRSKWGMFKADPADEEMIVGKAVHVLSPRVSDWHPTNSKQKDDEEHMTWFICTRTA